MGHPYEEERWHDADWLAAKRVDIEAELRAENSDRWWAAHEPYLDANWKAALWVLGV